jgi:predicted Zn-dependent peptidase
VLDDGLSSRLPHEIVERRGLAYSIHCGLDTFVDGGMLVVGAATAPRKAGLVAEAVLEVLARLAADGITGEELERVQRRHRLGLGFSLDSPADLAAWYGAGELLSSPEGLEARCRRVEGVRPADVRRVARQAFRASHLAAVVVGASARAERRLERLAEGGGPLPP